jgi:Matrixin
MKHVHRFSFSALALSVAGAFAYTLIASQPAAASGVPKWSLKQLAGFADVVVVARVDEIAPAWDPDSRSIYTFVTVTVNQALKGSVPQERIVIKQLGGRVGQVGLHVSDQADFHVGEKALLFLEVRPRDGTLYTSALWQGKWTVEDDWDGERLVTRHEPDAEAGSIELPRPMRDVERMVAQVGASGRRSQDIEFVPIGSQFAPANAAVASTRAFTLLGPLRYMFSPVVDVQAGGQPGLPGGGVREVMSAITKWNNAGSLFRYGLGSADAPPRCTTDELENARVTIAFMDPCNEMSNTGGTLAIGGSYYYFGDAGSVDGTVFNRASEGFIVTNDGPAALEYLTNPGCFEDVQTHELGHVLGLGHSLDPTAIMFPSININCKAGPRALGEDDVAGIAYIYGFRTSNRATAPLTAPSQVQVAVDGASITVWWTPVEALNSFDNAAANGYRVDFRRGHQDGGQMFVSFTTVATSLTVAIPPGLTGDFNVVVTPANGDGGGPPSFRKDFTICGGRPDPIGSVSATVVDGIAQLRWSPANRAASYRGQAGSAPGASDIYPLSELGATTSIDTPVGRGFSAWIRLFAVNSCGASAPVDVFLREP